MEKPYFKINKEDPSPLRATVSRRVRFEETDPLGIVWHGRYASYFEDARVALGEKYGIGYFDYYANKVTAPVKKMHIDYHRPLRLMEEFTVECIFHWSDALRINNEFIVRDSNNEIATTAYTVQVILDENNNLLLVPPPFIKALREKWKAGELK
jgi:acyl-CoA thioester hydrolase